MKITVSDTTCYVMPSVLSTDASDGNGNHHKKNVWCQPIHLTIVSYWL